MKTKVLNPIFRDKRALDEVERRVRALLRQEIFIPLLKILGEPRTRIDNAADSDDLLDAIRTGRLEFHRGKFRGKFDAQTSRELKKLGAKWDRGQGRFSIPLSRLPMELRNAISASEATFNKKAAQIDKRIAQILPEEVAGKFSATKTFSSEIFKTDKSIRDTLNGVSVLPELTQSQRDRIAREWQDNLQLYIAKFVEEEKMQLHAQLRKSIKKAVFTGTRYENLVTAIADRYDVSQSKAKFWARQETNLLMAKLKQVRYTDAGIDEYVWTCVAGTKDHPVRPDHKRLDGTKQRWDNPPIVNRKTGERKNPGQDYNCRCYPKPIVRFDRAIDRGEEQKSVREEH